MIFKKKKSFHVQEKKFNEWYAAYIDFIFNIPMIFGSLGGTLIYFSDKSGVSGVSFPTNSISLMILSLKFGNTGWYLTS